MEKYELYHATSDVLKKLLLEEAPFYPTGPMPKNPAALDLANPLYNDALRQWALEVTAARVS